MRTLRNPFLIIIIFLSMAIGSSTLTRGHEWGDDFASYIMQAQSILNDKTGEFVAHNTFTIFKSSFQIGPVAYPWGYPLILTPMIAIKGIHPLTLKLPGLFFFFGLLICFYLLTKDRLTRTESLLLVSLFAFNPMLIKFLDQILSDIPFLFFIFLGLFCARRDHLLCFLYPHNRNYPARKLSGISSALFLSPAFITQSNLYKFGFGYVFFWHISNSHIPDLS